MLPHTAYDVGKFSVTCSKYGTASDAGLLLYDIIAFACTGWYVWSLLNSNKYRDKIIVARDIVLFTLNVELQYQNISTSFLNQNEFSLNHLPVNENYDSKVWKIRTNLWYLLTEITPSKHLKKCTIAAITYKND